MTGIEICGYCLGLPLMITCIIFMIWCACLDHNPFIETKTETRTLYTYRKKGFDDLWEPINSWCTKYCCKEFPRYHDEVFLDKSEISSEVEVFALETIEYNYDRYITACKYPKLWKFLNDAGYFVDLEVITNLWMMEDLVRFSVWRTPNKNDFLGNQECDFFVTTRDVCVLEKRFGVDGNIQYKLKDEFLGE